MTIWWIIACAGIGTYLMRSVGVWLPARLIPTQWLTHLPFAVILVMAVNSVSSFHATPHHLIGAIAASSAVILASIRKLPLVLCIAIGCGVFGVLQ